MILLLDVGNARIKWVCFSKQLGFHQYGASAYASEGAWSQICAIWTQFERPTRVVIANVAGDEIYNRIAIWSKQEWARSPQSLRVDDKSHGIHIAYADPAKLGIDRWLAMLGGSSQCDMPFCVADCGTAITLDGVDAEGAHLGGMIIPGLTLMRKSLVSATNGIDLVSAPNASKHMLADNTSMAVLTGSIHAAAGTIERCVSMITKNLNRCVVLFITGGDAAEIQQYLTIKCHIDPLLVHKGMIMIAGDNK